MKVSFITTVFNEEKNIRGFLDSILKQTKQPNEIIVVDGGSTDKTYEILKRYKKKNKKIKVYQEKGANIARGRNIAISKATGDIILTSDAGCVVDKEWAEDMLSYFPREDFVAGGSKAIVRNDFEFFQAMSTIKKVNNFARMSGRNSAFKKECWVKAGGYPERSLTGEDHRFHINVAEKGYKIKINEKRLVAWEMRPSLRKFFKQFYGYGKGDGQQGNFFKKSLLKNLIMIIVFWFYLLVFFVSLFFYPFVSLDLILIPTIFLGVYALYMFFKTKKISAFFYAPAFLIIKRIGYILGATFR